MDTRNYDEPYNCGLENCECREDDNCGCTFPNNMSNFSCQCAIEDECKNFDQEAKKKTLSPPEIHISENTVCHCSADNCECNTTQTVSRG